MRLSRVCVFCGSSSGLNPAYGAVALELAAELVERGLGLVYGGSRVGLMGMLAEAVQDRGGSVIGVIPTALVDKELAHTAIADLRIVGSMHERKALMADLADGFIALPGGFGTLEEFAETVTWTQLGLQSKPAGLLDVEGYWTGLLEFLDHGVAEGFIKPVNRALVLHDPSVAGLLDQMGRWEPPLAVPGADSA